MTDAELNEELMDTNAALRQRLEHSIAYLRTRLQHIGNERAALDEEERAISTLLRRLDPK